MRKFPVNEIADDIVKYAEEIEGAFEGLLDEIMPTVPNGRCALRLDLIRGRLAEMHGIAEVLKSQHGKGTQ